MTEPKQVSDFAKEYEQIYVGYGQCKAAHAEVSRQLNEIKAKHQKTINGFSHDFKTKFNLALDGYDALRNSRGKFRLTRELDFEVKALMQLFMIAFEQLEADKIPAL